MAEVAIFRALQASNQDASTSSQVVAAPLPKRKHVVVEDVSDSEDVSPRLATQGSAILESVDEPPASAPIPAPAPVPAPVASNPAPPKKKVPRIGKTKKESYIDEATDRHGKQMRRDFARSLNSMREYTTEVNSGFFTIQENVFGYIESIGVTMTPKLEDALSRRKQTLEAQRLTFLSAILQAQDMTHRVHGELEEYLREGLPKVLDDWFNKTNHSGSRRRSVELKRDMERIKEIAQSVSDITNALNIFEEDYGWTMTLNNITHKPAVFRQICSEMAGKIRTFVMIMSAIYQQGLGLADMIRTCISSSNQILVETRIDRLEITVTYYVASLKLTKIALGAATIIQEQLAEAGR